MLSWTLAAYPRVYEQHAARLFSLMAGLLAR
jgi:hypothetical protein